MVKYTFKCKDIGYDKCSYEVAENDREYVISKVKMHAKYAHGKTDFTEELRKTVDNAINEVQE